MGRYRDSSQQSLDDTYRSGVSVHRNSSTGSSNSGQAGTSPVSTSGLVPIHIRAASTPVQTENARTDLVQHKRFPSSVEGVSKHNKSDPGIRKDITKKFSLDNIVRSDDRQVKRASSETPDKFSKRNSSSPAAVSLLAFTNERSQRLDEMPPRSGQSSTKHKGSLKATPELLAELLKGSSEKMAKAEQKTKNDNSNALPTAVLRCLVSEQFKLTLNKLSSWLTETRPLHQYTI